MGEYLIDGCGTQAAIRSGVGLFGVNTRARHCMKVQGERSSLMAGAKMSALGRMVAYLKPSAIYAVLRFARCQIYHEELNDVTFQQQTPPVTKK